jgi:hypothetical protein
MNETLSFASIETSAPAVFCDHCGKPFTPRNGSGGKAQKFCSPECRQSFHAQRSQRREPHVGDSEPIAIEQPPPEIPTSETPEDSERDFSWCDELIVVPAQPAIAVYLNPRGEVVIRQEGPGLNGYDDDHFIYVQVKNLGPLIDRLRRIARGEIVMD